MKLVLDVEGLAEALSLAVSTVRADASRAPEKLPPRLNTPYDKPLWAVEDVQQWIRERSINYEPFPDARIAPQESGCSRPAKTLSRGARSRLQDLGLLDAEQGGS